MDLDKYRALICALDCGSISAAAEHLQYTPSGISRMLSALESELGFPLLVREHSGVHATAECELMLPLIRRLIHCGESCMQLSARIRGLEYGSVTAATAYSAFYPWLAELTSEFHALHPGLQVQLQSGYSSELSALVAERQIDLAIISRREGVENWLPICEDEMVAWVPGGHPLTAWDSVPVECFAREAYIETYPNADIDNTRVFSRCGITPNLKFSTMDSYATCAMVDAGLGISMNNAINSLARSGNVRIMPLDPPQTVELGIAYPSDASPAARAFLDFIRERLHDARKYTRQGSAGD